MGYDKISFDEERAQAGKTAAGEKTLLATGYKEQPSSVLEPSVGGVSISTNPLPWTECTWTGTRSCKTISALDVVNGPKDMLMHHWKPRLWTSTKVLPNTNRCMGSGTTWLVTVSWQEGFLTRSDSYLYECCWNPLQVLYLSLFALGWMNTL